MESRKGTSFVRTGLILYKNPAKRRERRERKNGREKKRYARARLIKLRMIPYRRKGVFLISPFTRGLWRFDGWCISNGASAISFMM
jgi:hypothetical protein